MQSLPQVYTRWLKMPETLKDNLVTAALASPLRPVMDKPEKSDAFSLHDDGSALCDSYNGGEYCLDADCTCECTGYETRRRCRHSRELSAANRVVLDLAKRYPKTVLRKCTVQEKPCGTCGGYVVTCLLHGQWPFSDCTGYLTARVCGCREVLR